MLVILTIIVFYKEFLVLAFDATLAVVLRLPAKSLRYLLLILIGVTIVVSLQTVGVALVLAMLITPAAAAQLLTRRLSTMMVVAAMIGVSRMSPGSTSATTGTSPRGRPWCWSLRSSL